MAGVPHLGQDRSSGFNSCWQVLQYLGGVSSATSLTSLFRRRLLWGIRGRRTQPHVTRITITYLRRKRGATSENAVYANFGEITQSIRCPVRTPVFLLTKTFLSQGFIGEFRGRFESLARVLSSPETSVPQAGLSTHSGSGVIWDSGCGPGPSRPVELTVITTRTFLSRSARVWHESLTCPRRFRLSSTSSSALVIFSGSPSRYSMRQVVHLA